MPQCTSGHMVVCLLVCVYAMKISATVCNQALKICNVSRSRYQIVTEGLVFKLWRDLLT